MLSNLAVFVACGYRHCSRRSTCHSSASTQPGSRAQFGDHGEPTMRTRQFGPCRRSRMSFSSVPAAGVYDVGAIGNQGRKTLCPRPLFKPACRRFRVDAGNLYQSIRVQYSQSAIVKLNNPLLPQRA